MRNLRFFVLIVLAVTAAGGWFWEKKAADAPDQKNPVAAGEKLSTPAVPSVSDILIDDFEIGATEGIFEDRKNRLDAFQGTWSRRPSYTMITKVPDSRPGRKGNSLRIEYNKQAGWCGWYTLLNGVNASQHNALTFWIRGETGSERFDIGFMDGRMQDLEIDSIYVGPIMAFLPSGVTTDWQQVVVPLASIRSDLDLSRMGSLVFSFRYEGRGAVQIDDVAFVADPVVEKKLEQNQPRMLAALELPRATWVWKVDPVNNLEARKELLAFSKRAGLKTLYLFFGEEPLSKTPADYQKPLAELLRQAHQEGVKIEALQGNPLWATKEYHPAVLAWVSGILDFNKAQKPESRIDGIHLDIEPYLTAGWETGERDILKTQYLELMAQLRQLLDSRAADAGRLEFGVAIPVFYSQEMDDFEKGILQHVDYVALMDYYDTATDILENARWHVDLANQLGKKIVIGVETQDLVQMGQGKRRNTFQEEGWEEMERQLAEVVERLKSEPSFAGLAIHDYSSYRFLQKGRNVPTQERTGKVPRIDAAPAAGQVEIDGSLSDWGSIPWTTISERSNVVYGGGAWNGAADLSVKAAFQWQPEALLIALDVTDDKHVQQKQNADIWEGDHVEIWVDADLYGDYTEAVNSSDDFQLGFSPGDFGPVPGDIHLWVPPTDPAKLSGVQAAAKPKKPSGYVMEIRLPLSLFSGALPGRASHAGVPAAGGEALQLPQSIQNEAKTQINLLSEGKLKEGVRFGIAVVCSDTDDPNQPQKCMIASTPEHEWGDPTSFNVMELK